MLSSRDARVLPLLLVLEIIKIMLVSDRSNRKLADLEVENMHEVSLDIPLSRQFTPTDVYNALTRNVQQNRPYAEYLVASREGNAMFLCFFVAQRLLA